MIKNLKRAIRSLSIGGLIFLFSLTLLQLLIHLPQGSSVILPDSETSLTLYSNQTDDDLTKLYQNAIGQAKKSITLSIYGLKDRRIIQSLEKKCEEGISLHLVCDPTATDTLDLPQAKIVKRAGKGIMHQKILIVDHHLLLLGSANLTFSSLNIHGNLVIGIENHSLAKQLAKRIESMDEDGSLTPLFSPLKVMGDQQVEVWLLPDHQIEANKKIIKLIQSAQKSIQIAMFMWTRSDIAQELIKASKKGIKVEVVIDQNNGKGAGSKIVKMLANGGIPVTLSTGKGLLHHKFAYIDESILINGSANWTKRAFQENDDYFVVISPLSSPQKSKMNRLFETISNQSQAP